MRECNLFIHYISYVSIPSFCILFAAAFLFTTAGNPGLFLLEQTCKAGVSSTFLWVGQKANKNRQTIPQKTVDSKLFEGVLYSCRLIAVFACSVASSFGGKCFKNHSLGFQKNLFFGGIWLDPKKTTYLIQTPPFTHFSGCIWGRPGIWSENWDPNFGPPGIIPPEVGHDDPHGCISK